MNTKERRECTSIHHSEDSCNVSVMYVCGECGARFHWWERDKADDCCVYDQLHDFADPVPTCLCGKPATDEDLSDSKRLGTLIRCRSCILAVAPELLTADAIIFQKAA